MTAPLKFFRQIWDELKLVVWPTRKEVIRLTIIVIILSVIMGMYIGGLDYVFTTAVETLLR
ncbi:MAG: preprotein translocase subunit SecE [Candidatus Levybacteria bacterium]|nr:preprotein translocase subunit SecE [Candidatus Levybacteria bacterium]